MLSLTPDSQSDDGDLRRVAIGTMRQRYSGGIPSWKFVRWRVLALPSPQEGRESRCDRGSSTTERRRGAGFEGFAGSVPAVLALILFLFLYLPPLK
jgi:hypothetical protein